MAAQTGLVVANSPEAALNIVRHSGVVRDLEQMRDVFEAIRAHAVVVAPVSVIGALPPLHRVQLNAVLLDPKNGNGDVYVDKAFCSKDEGALTKNALLKVMAAAGISIEAPPRLIQHPQYTWTCSVSIVGRGLDGQLRRVVATKEIDITDGSPATLKWNDARTKRVPMDQSAIDSARKHAPAMCETKALLRALRAWFGLKQKYTLTDLSKPFVVPCLVLDLDPNNPLHLKYIVGIGTGATAALFGPDPGPGQAALPPGAPEVVTPAAAIKTEQAPPDDDDGIEDAVVTGSPEDLAAELAGFDTPGPPPEPPKLVCGCACGHQVLIDESTAQLTLDRLGIRLCVVCIPGRRFDEAAHAGLRRLNFPNKPALNDPAAAIAHARAERAKAAKR